MAYSAGENAFRVNYELCPITMNGGVASNILGGTLSLLSVLQSIDYNGILSNISDPGLDGYFATFMPLPGSTLIDNQIGNYPFANRSVAANAIIAQPLSISMLMRVPATANVSYSTKQSLMTAMQNTLSQHNTSEGTFTVATPSFFFSDLILLHLSDVSGGETHQSQVEWKWDFIKPLITLQDAYIQQNAMMSSLSSGAVTDGSLSGSSVVNGDSNTVSTPAISPASQATPSSGLPSSSGSSVTFAQ